MTCPRTLLAVLGAAALLAGCNDRATPPTLPAPPAPRPVPGLPAPTQPSAPGAGDRAAGAPAPHVVLIFRAERDAVPVRPGGEARVKLLSVPEGEDLTVTVQPPDSRLSATADHDALTIRAGNEATGESVVTVKAGKETARVTVKVEAGKK